MNSGNQLSIAYRTKNNNNTLNQLIIQVICFQYLYNILNCKTIIKDLKNSTKNIDAC